MSYVGGRPVRQVRLAGNVTREQTPSGLTTSSDTQQWTDHRKTNLWLQWPAREARKLLLYDGVSRQYYFGGEN